MKNLFDELGAYNYTSFTGASGIWKLISTESNGELKNTLDTFSNGKGEERKYERHQVWEQARLGNIKPIANTEIKIKNIPKKDWDKIIIKDSFNNQNEETL